MSEPASADEKRPLRVGRTFVFMVGLAGSLVLFVHAYQATRTPIEAVGGESVWGGRLHWACGHALGYTLFPNAIYGGEEPRTSDMPTRVAADCLAQAHHAMWIALAYAVAAAVVLALTIWLTTRQKSDA